MMERLSLYLADRMYQNRIINSDDKRFYSYSIQLLLERTIGIFLICFFAALLKNLLEVSLFLVIFALIRRYSDGVHCKTSIGCFVSSVLMSLSTIPLCSCILLHPCICQGGLIISMIIVFCIGTIRNPDLGLTVEEFVHLKRRSRVTIIFVGASVLILMVLFPQYKYVSFMALTMITLMILVVGIFATNASAASGYYNYGVSSRTTLGCEWNGSTDWEFYARAVPTSGVTKLQLCDTTGNTIYVEDVYPYNPKNPTYIHCPIYSGDYISTFGIPYGCNYTSGKAYWAF